MKSIQETTKTSIILITHDLSVVAGFCDRILVMYAGQIVEDAPVERLFSHPQHPYTVRLLQSIPRLNMSKDQPLIPIEGRPPDLSHVSQGCPFWMRCHDAMNICPKKKPSAYEVSQDHLSVCWKHEKERLS
jgi:oligopeptide transport system ATP-binding protein